MRKRGSVSHETMSAGRLHVPQPSTGSSKRSVSNSCTLRLADVQLMGQSADSCWATLTNTPTLLVGVEFGRIAIITHRTCNIVD